MGRLERLFDSSLQVFTVSTLLHEIVIPIAFYGVYKMGFSKKSFYVAFLIFILALLPITYFSTPHTANINCVNYPCDTSRSDYGEKITESNFYMTPYYLLYVIGFWSLLFIISYFTLTPILNALNVKIED